MTPTIVVLRGGGAAFVLRQDGENLPHIVHWGTDLPDAALADALAVAADRPVPQNALDQPWDLTVLPTSGSGWLGTPAWEAHRGGGGAAPRWRASLAGGGGEAVVRAADAGAAAAVTLVYRMDPDGILTVDTTARNLADDVAGPPLDLSALRVVLPLPARATEVLDLTGRWLRERAPQRHPLLDGSWVRTGRRGRTGHDSTLLIVCGTTGFGFRHGEVWAAHVGWSGNHEHVIERLPEGAGAHAAVLGGSESLAPGEVRLGPGESYTAPTVYFGYSAAGLDGLTNAFVRHQRTGAGRRATSRKPRPLVLNTWEAVYFETDIGRLIRLADLAARVGVERFVLDDGWFGSRRDDSRALGDWQVSSDVWPQGLHPLVDHVRGLGMEFGLWVEPEMISLDSDLARAHPDWVLGPAAGRPAPSRRQHVLDLANPAASGYLLDALGAVISEYHIDALKWDHNRDLHEAVRTDRSGIDRPAVAGQTRAVYALLDELRRRHPGVEIESCASGGGRVDLGILARTERVWASDCNDALERVAIQRWTGLLVPPERIGAHVAAERSHTTHRAVDLSFRMLIALQGHAGLEWDLTACTEEELDELRSWAALYRELRGLLHTGDVVRSDHPDESLVVGGVVAADRSAAVFTLARIATGRGVTPGAVPLPGLDPARRYRVRVRRAAGLPATVAASGPRWFDEALEPAGVEVAGSVLGGLGLHLPVLAPAQGFLLHLTIVDDS
jgi:alpha-galactosidase